MKCPYCGMEMSLGYIQCRDSVTSNKMEQLVVAISDLGADLVLANESGIFSGSSVVTYNCQSCKKIIIDHLTNKERLSCQRERKIEAGSI